MLSKNAYLTASCFKESLDFSLRHLQLPKYRFTLKVLIAVKYVNYNSQSNGTP